MSMLWLAMAGLMLLVMLCLLLPLRVGPSIAGLSKQVVAGLVALFMMVLLGSVLLYMHLGASDKLALFYKQRREAHAVQAEIARIKSPAQVITQLQATLRAHPASARGWYLLGRLYLGLHQYTQAVKVMRKAHMLDKSSREYAVAYAEAYFFAHHQKLSLSLKQLLEGLVKNYPSDTAALNLLAINSFVQHNYRQALAYWEKMLPQFAVGSSDQKTVLAMIAKAQHHIKPKL